MHTISSSIIFEDKKLQFIDASEDKSNFLFDTLVQRS